MQGWFEIPSGILEELKQVKDITAQEILSNLLDGSENLDLKTHINKPKQLAGLNVVCNLLENSEFTKSSDIIRSFIEIYLRYMVSYNRMSRTEVIKALSHIIEVEESNRLTTDLS